MQTNTAVEQNKNINGPRVRRVSPVGKGKVYGGNDLPQRQVLSSYVFTYLLTERQTDKQTDKQRVEDNLMTDALALNITKIYT